MHLQSYPLPFSGRPPWKNLSSYESLLLVIRHKKFLLLHSQLQFVHFYTDICLILHESLVLFLQEILSDCFFHSQHQRHLLQLLLVHDLHPWHQLPLSLISPYDLLLLFLKIGNATRLNLLKKPKRMAFLFIYHYSACAETISFLL